MNMDETNSWFLKLFLNVPKNFLENKYFFNSIYIDIHIFKTTITQVV